MSRRNQRRQPIGIPTGGQWADQGGRHGDVSDLPPIPGTPVDLDEPFSGPGYGPYRIDSTRICKWHEGLSESDQTKVREAMKHLSQLGPALRRPVVGKIVGSRHSNMKELRPLSSFIRILFLFDPESKAVMLVAGDKRDAWNKWYDRNIPIADDLADEIYQV